MEAMIVDPAKLAAVGWRAERINDGSVRLLRYKKSETTQELLTVTPDRYDAGRFTLRVALPAAQTLDAAVVIVRSSANCYKAVYTSLSATEIRSFGNYCDLNMWLRSIDQYRMDLKPARCEGLKSLNG
jgi:hypothetical protein